ncbi:MAG: molybdate transport system substrate-binding protein [Dinoroseobacter sp.]|jgi:molybdate transport system substrate-binding protein
MISAIFKRETRLPQLFIAALFASALAQPFSVRAEELRVAVASNFKDTFKVIAQNFEDLAGHTVLISSGSTGKHFAQIANGAPFDLFLAADAERPRLVEQRGLGILGSRRTYAIGKLALLSNLTQQGTSNQDPSQLLTEISFRHLAIANPSHAPYGIAAIEVLTSKGLWPKLKPKLVRGENIAQTFQFVKSGNAELGFIAYSQIIQLSNAELGPVWIVPQNLYTPIEQQLILLKESVAGRELLNFLETKMVLEIIRQYGYDTPDVK